MIEPALAGPLAAGVLLDGVEAARGGRPLFDWLVLTAAAQRAGPTPVEVIAGVLRRPAEAVGRRLLRLERQGACALTADRRGVCAEVHCDPEGLAGAFAAYEQVEQFYHRLRDLDLWRAPAGPREPAAHPPIGPFLRLFGDYVLRSAEATPGGGDVAEPLLLLATLRANGWDAANPRPAAAGPLARRLGLSSEDARRLASRLVAQRGCVRDGKGLIAPAGLLAQPAWTRFISASLYGLTRMLGGLDELGVLAAWEARRA